MYIKQIDFSQNISEISNVNASDNDESIVIASSDGTEVVKITDDGLSVNGVDFTDKQDKLIAGTNITIGDDGKTISASGGSSISEISEETTTDEDEEQVFMDDTRSETYAKIGSYGIKAKAYYDLEGNESYHSILYGKKIASVGDSVTFGAKANTIEDENSAYYPLNATSNNKLKTFMYYIVKKNGAKWYNYGISGSCMGDVYSVGRDRNGFSKENGRYTQMANDLDYIMLMFGTNDIGQGTYMKAEEYVQDKYGSYHKYPTDSTLIGTEGYMTTEEYNDIRTCSGTISGETYTGLDYFLHAYIGVIDDRTNKTWYGAWNIVLPYLMQKYPLAKILIWVNPVNTTLDESTKEIAKKWGVAYLDIKDEGNPCFWTMNTAPTGMVTEEQNVVAFRHTYYLADATHPNDAGYQQLFPILESKLKSI